MIMTLENYDEIDTIPKPSTPNDPFLRYRSSLAPGNAGPWTLERFQIEKDLTLLRAIRDGRGTPPGSYTRLVHKDRGVVMSDTNAEIIDHMPFFRRAKGRVLIHGLGMGMALQAVLRIPQVERVDVVEIDADVIKLVGSQVQNDRVEFHHADCLKFKWESGRRWDVVWHDIWDTICEDNRPQMTTLSRSFSRRCNWQGFWSKDWMDSRR